MSQQHLMCFGFNRHGQCNISPSSSPLLSHGICSIAATFSYNVVIGSSGMSIWGGTLLHDEVEHGEQQQQHIFLSNEYIDEEWSIINGNAGSIGIYFLNAMGSLRLLKWNMMKELTSMHANMTTHELWPSSIRIYDVCEDRICAVTDNGDIIHSQDGNELSLMKQHMEHKQHQIKSVSCGGTHTALLTNSLEVLMVGMGSHGQLGLGDSSSSDIPVLVDSLLGLRVAQVSCGGWHTVAVLEGSNDIYAWGWNKYGQLGIGTHDDHRMLPELLDALPVDDDDDNDKNRDSNALSAPVAKIACGRHHTAVVLENGSLWTCGWNKHGQLGVPNSRGHDRLVKVMNDGVMDVVCGPWHTVCTKRALA